MIDHKMQDNIAMHGVSYFLDYFSSSLFEVTYSNKRVERSDRLRENKAGLGCSIAFSPLNRC